MKSTETMHNTLHRLAGEPLDLEMADAPDSVQNQFLKAKFSITKAAHEFAKLNRMKDKHKETQHCN